MNNILYYDNVNVSNTIRGSDRNLMIPFLSRDYSDNLFHNYDKFGLNKHNAVYDRTGNLPHYFEHFTKPASNAHLR
jgi:hypothetical protein